MQLESTKHPTQRIALDNGLYYPMCYVGHLGLGDATWSFLSDGNEGNMYFETLEEAREFLLANPAPTIVWEA